MKTKIIVALSVLISLATHSQTPDTLWTRTYGGSSYDVANGVAELPGGGFMVGGYFTQSNYKSDMWLLRVNSSGELVEEDKIGDMDLLEQANTLEPALDGKFILAGFKEDQDDHTTNAFIIKVDSNGNGWGFTYGAMGEYTYLYDAVATVYDEVIGVGHQTNEEVGADVYEVGTFSNGLFKWDNWIDWNLMDYARSIARTSDGGFIVTGESNSVTGSYAIFLQKLDPVGIETGLLFYTFMPNLYARSVQQTLDGGYIVVGYHEYVSSPTKDIIVLKTDSAGTIDWWKQYDGGADRIDVGADVQVLPDSGYIVVGTGAYNIYGWDIWLLRLDSNGDTLWTKFIGEQNVDESASQIRMLADGGYIISGTKGVATGNSDAYLVRLGPEPVGVKDKYKNLPKEFTLYQNYPNPFNPTTNIRWQQPEAGFVTLEIYDVLGREVTTLVNEELSAGKHETIFDASSISNGVYFYQLKAGNYIQTKKMILIK